MGLAHGKTEAWYILTAAPGAKVALGLTKRLAPHQLREAIEDGSIAGLVAWRPVLPGDVVFVPAGAIHAIGAGRWLQDPAAERRNVPHVRFRSQA